MAKVAKMLTESKKQELVALVKQRKNIDLLAQKAGVSINELEKIMAFDPELPNKYWYNVWKVVEPDTYVGLIRTATFQTIYNACENARNNMHMICVIGDTGLGKTTAAETYSKMNEVFYVRIDGTYNDNVFLTELMHQLGISAIECSPHHCLNKIATKLNFMENPLIIVDECSKMKAKLMLTLHALRDKTINNCGIVLLGMPYFKNNLIKRIKKGELGYSEFYRRINIWEELDTLKRDEIVFILESRGIHEKQDQQQFLKINRFGDLDNAIKLFVEVNKC